MKREFYVDTPLGKLRVSAKHDADYPDNFPGIWVELVQTESDYGALLVCVEYESSKKELQCVAYQSADEDNPSHVVLFDLSQDSIVE